jgi:hypothetical protein
MGFYAAGYLGSGALAGDCQQEDKRTEPDAGYLVPPDPFNLKPDQNLDIAYSVMLKCSHVVSQYYSRF